MSPGLKRLQFHDLPRGLIEGHAKVQVKYRVRVRDRVKCRLRDMVWVTVSVRVRSQEAPSTDSTRVPLSP